MTARPVRNTGKNTHGDITSVGDATWGIRLKADAIRDIETGAHSYYVPWTSGSTPVNVVPADAGKYLRTDRDNTIKNNLLDLPSV